VFVAVAVLFRADSAPQIVQIGRIAPGAAHLIGRVIPSLIFGSNFVAAGIRGSERAGSWFGLRG
jgi:hypothetical protein